MRFNENLRRLRKEKDYSQEYLAEKLSVTRQTVSKWENATAMPDLKKLTELADFFNVSMDALLGLELDSKEDEQKKYPDTEPTDNNENNKEYAKQLFSVAYQNQYEQSAAGNRFIRAVTIVFGIIIFCIVLVIFLLFNNLHTSITDLQNQINQLRAADVSVSIPDEDDYGFNCELLSVDKDKPYMVKTRFTYSPKSYAKDAKVYFTVQGTDGKIKKLEAKNTDGNFVAEGFIDITTQEEWYAVTECEQTIQKQLLDCDIYNNRFISVEDAFDFFLTNQTDKIYCSVSSSIPVMPAVYTFSDDIVGNFTKAYLVAEDNGKIVYRAPLKFEKSVVNDVDVECHYTFSAEDMEFTVDNHKNISSVYIQLENENGIECKYYASINGNYQQAEQNDVETIGINNWELIFSPNKVLKGTIE